MNILGGRMKLKPVRTHEGDKPKVLIGVAGFQGVMAEAQENFFEMAYHIGRRCPEYDFLLKIVIKREQFRARNTLVDLAIINGCEYLLMLDDDMIVPPDVFARLVAHKKDAIGALYFQRGGAYHPVLMKRFTKTDGLIGIDFLNHFDPMVTQRGLYKIDGVIGGGCMLFRTEIFNRVPQPYFWIDGIVGTDVHVCEQLRTAGVELWADTTVELGHIGEQKIITSRTIPQYAKVVGAIAEEIWEDIKGYTGLDNLQLESEMWKSAHDGIRKRNWNQERRDTWEGVRAYYQGFGNWHILNLGKFNLMYDQARDWAVNQIDSVCQPGSRIADVGTGLGYCVIPLARRGYNVTAMDLDKSPTLDFLKWRLSKHNLTIPIVAFDSPIPPDLEEKQDGVLLVSVFEHLWDPIGMLDWVERNVKRGGWMLNDGVRNLSTEEDPQHLVKYDPHRIVNQLRKRGWKETPENPFLFFWEG